jgi:hypothetical protein
LTVVALLTGIVACDPAEWGLTIPGSEGGNVTTPGSEGSNVSTPGSEGGDVTIPGVADFCDKAISYELADTSVVVTEVYGRIGNLSMTSTKDGLAGVEAVFRFDTTGRRLTGIAVEILGWYERGSFVTGVTIIDHTTSPQTTIDRTVELSNPAQMLSFQVIGHTTAGIHIIMKDSLGTTLLDYTYEHTFVNLFVFKQDLEYWRYPVPGNFQFSGTVILDWAYSPDIGYINLANGCAAPYFTSNCPNTQCCEFLSYNHYRSGDSFVFEGAVID